MRKLFKSKSHALHNTTLDALEQPYWLVKGALRDMIWIIRTADPDTHFNAEVKIDFNQQISPWPKLASLTDPQYELDLLTIKLVIFYALKPRPIGWVKSANTIKKDTFPFHLNVLRWRIDRGISSNSKLSGAWFNEFDTSVKEGGREGLLRLSLRADAFLQASQHNVKLLERDARGDIRADILAKRLGISKANALTTSARATIESYFASKGRRYTRTSASRQSPIEINLSTVGGNAHKYYRVWFDLWKLRDYLTHDPIGHCQYKRLRDVAKWVKNWPIQAERTPDIPVYQASFLINSALKIVLDPACDLIFDIFAKGLDQANNVIDRQTLAALNRRLTGLGFCHVGQFFMSNHDNVPDCTSFYRFVFGVIPTAARIVTATFSARRNEEIESSSTDCIEKDASSNYWLSCLIVKNVDRVDRIPVPNSVARAVELVKKIRQLGEKSGKKLYDFACPIFKKGVKFNLRETLPRFAEFCRVPLLESGEAWNFTPHQFRKFFGVTYHWRWAFPDLTALTFQYRHFNSDTTLGYIEMKAAEALRLQDEKLAAHHRRDIERKAEFDSGRVSFTKWVYEQVINGAVLSGPLGRRITNEVRRLTDELKPEMQVTGGEAVSGMFNEVISKLVGSGSITAHPEGHSLCGCGKTKADLSQSVCLGLKQKLTGILATSASGPDFGFADDDGCLVCPHRAALPVMAPRWEREASLAEAALAHALPGSAPRLKERLRLIHEYA